MIEFTAMPGTKRAQFPKIVFFFALLLPLPLVAGEIERNATQDLQSVFVADAHMPVRAEPDPESKIVGRARLMWNVWVTPDERGPVVTVDGREDRWVRVVLPVCADTGCRMYKTGWTLDSFLGYEDRFERLDGLAPTTLVHHDGRRMLAYEIRADGEFSRFSAPCFAGMCSFAAGPKPDCPEPETRRGDFCVMSGSLVRYRDLVRGKDAAGEWLPFGLTMSSSGSFCPLPRDRGDEPKGEYLICFVPDPEPPATALVAAMDEMRPRLALVAADMLNLRVEPSGDAAIVTRVPQGSAVTVLPPDGPAIEVDGRSDRWVRVRVDTCYSFMESGLCQPGTAGWVVDGFLAYEDRLQPMAAWRAGMIGGYGGDYGFSYLFLEDGGVEFTESCGDYREGRSCTAEGRLYRYRNLVLARFPSLGRYDVLSIDADGRLCFPLAEETGDIIYEAGDGRPTRCDR